MNEEERKQIIRKIEREIYLSHIRGQLPPNFNRTLSILKTMGIDPDELLDNAFYKFDLLNFLCEMGDAEPLASNQLNFKNRIVVEAETLEASTSPLKKGLKSFTVSGDSMKGVGIENGDVVLIEEVPFENGGIYVVKVEDTYFVKRVERTHNGYRLISENEKYKPVEIKSDIELQIVGKVKYILKKVGNS